MPRPQLTPAQRQKTRRKIQDAALKLFRAQGPSTITARSVAKEAGVSVGTLYTHFENLTELGQSLWKGPVRRLRRELEAISAAEPDALRRVDALLTAYIDFAIAEPSVYRGAFLYIRPETHEKPRRAPPQQSILGQELIPAIEAGQATGQFRSGDAAALAQTLWSGIHGAFALPTNIDRISFIDAPEIAHTVRAALLDWLTRADAPA